MSYYLDDMLLQTGEEVRCKATISALNLTEGKVYMVERQDYGSRHNTVAGIRNDKGDWIIPSARFDRVEK